MSRLIGLVVVFLSALVCRSDGEEVASQEFGFAVTTPEGNGWRIVNNGIAGERNRSHVVLVANQADKRSLALYCLPLGKKTPTGEPVTSLADAKDGFEKGFLKKADGKVSSQDLKVAGQEAYQIVALKKLPTGEERHVVAVFFIANGRDFSISAVTKIPWDKDEDYRRFLDSVRITKP